MMTDSIAAVFPDGAAKTRRPAVQQSSTATELCRNSVMELASKLCGEGDETRRTRSRTRFSAPSAGSAFNSTRCITTNKLVSTFE